MTLLHELAETTAENRRLRTINADLVEALQEAERLYMDTSLVGHTSECGDWITKARAAIAKAMST